MGTRLDERGRRLFAPAEVRTEWGLSTPRFSGRALQRYYYPLNHALAPAQRAGAQRLCALAPFGRRSVERAEPLLSPASKNRHMSGSPDHTRVTIKVADLLTPKCSDQGDVARKRVLVVELVIESIL